MNLSRYADTLTNGLGLGILLLEGLATQGVLAPNLANLLVGIFTAGALYFTGKPSGTEVDS